MSWTGHDGNGHGRKYIHVTETPDVSHITNPDVMHEESDVNVRGVGAFVGALFAGLIVIAALMVGLFKGFERYAEYKDERIAVSPMARTEAERLPPPPRLQAAPGFVSLDDPNMSFALKEPAAEWNALREKWEYELNNPGAVDPNTQARRIPIKDAMQMLLDKGLPVRQQQSGQSTNAGADVPSYSSAGRQTDSRR
ncbi:MAG: hypothetical protein QOF61_2738 [Acidobacteriota bacterium]|nr:hypothetical protein [Acidobacteriota bacterium]